MKILSLRICILLSSSVIIGLMSCRTSTPTEAKSTCTDSPACITEKINSIKSATVRNPPSSVWQYEYNGKPVYYIPPYCCDAFGELYDCQCNLICYPDGGISGRGDGKCPDIFTKLNNKKLVWQDERTYPPKK